MAKVKSGSDSRSITKVVKRTKIGGKFKTSSMNKHEKRSFKRYRGQGK